MKGMSIIAKVGRKTQAKPQVAEITCLSCGITKKSGEFYASQSVYNAGTGRVQYCRVCCIEMSCDSNGNIDVEKFKETLRKIDKPFLPDVLESAYEEAKKNDKDTNPLQLYFKNINSLPQYNSLTWKNSAFIKSNEQSYDEIIVGQELINFWGKNWEPDEYIRLQEFYQSMVDMNSPETPQDIDYIKKISRLSIQIDKAIEEGNSSAAKSLGDLYSKYMGDAKLRTTDGTDADKSGGVRRFCDIFSEVEKDDFIPPWEHYRKINGAKQDIVDKTIMFILNFMLKFNRADKLTKPPIDTPKIENDEIDEKAQAAIELEDLQDLRDMNLDVIDDG